MEEFVSNYPVFHNQAMDQDLTSDPIKISHFDNLGFIFHWTGTPTGTFSFEVSNDLSTWAVLSVSPSIASAGSEATALATINQLPVMYIRLKYDRTSGDGVLNISMSGKEL